MDFDDVGQMNKNAFAEKLGAVKTKVVREMQRAEVAEFLSKYLSDKQQLESKLLQFSQKKLKDANDVLQFFPGLIPAMLKNSHSQPQSNVIRFSSLRSSVRNRVFNQEKFDGVKSIHLDWFNRIFKGFRRGELIKQVDNSDRSNRHRQDDIVESNEFGLLCQRHSNVVVFIRVEKRSGVGDNDQTVGRKRFEG